ncbi:CRE-RIL-1 protein [Aphelenchoides avenae]|nr:CRE-RIL-1 protein [Aphelenchus avenae]
MGLVARVWHGVKWTAETFRGAAVVLASPKAPIPPTKLHPRMMARPMTLGEFFRMFSWRYNWKYQPIIRTWLESAAIVWAIYYFVLPIKPRHMVQFAQAQEDSHHKEVEHEYGLKQKLQDQEHFKKYDPLRAIRPHVEGAHH